MHGFTGHAHEWDDFAVAFKKHYHVITLDQRELLEETGYKTSEITLIGECFPQPAILSNKCFFYLAQEVESVQTQELDSGEDIDIFKMPLK